jgi:hypothetical protein
MTTEYQQVPSQQAFYSAQNTELDPWLITATSNLTLNWGGKGSKRHLVHSPPSYGEETRWSPPTTPTFKLAKRPVPSQYISTSSPLDPWAIVHQDTQEQDDSATDSSTEEEVINQSLYKTELCRSYQEHGSCRYGNKCQFAHGKTELRPVLRHPKYKTEICKTFHILGTCPYGTRCRFIHNKPKGGFSSVPNSPSFTSPYASPPIRNARMSRTPSPPSVVPDKWSTSWHSKKPPVMHLDLEVEEAHEDDDSTVPSASDSIPSRLAIYLSRAAC